MLSLDDFKALEETAYLLRNPANALKLLNSIDLLNGGSGVIRAIVE
jgi:antitoxin YefM